MEKIDTAVVETEEDRDRGLERFEKRIYTQMAESGGALLRDARKIAEEVAEKVRAEWAPPEWAKAENITKDAFKLLCNRLELNRERWEASLEGSGGTEDDERWDAVRASAGVDHEDEVTRRMRRNHKYFSCAQAIIEDTYTLRYITKYFNRVAAMLPLEWFYCPGCGNCFEPKRKDQVYCTRKCGDRVRSLEYLKRKRAKESGT